MGSLSGGILTVVLSDGIFLPSDGLTSSVKLTLLAGMAQSSASVASADSESLSASVASGQLPPLKNASKAFRKSDMLLSWLTEFFSS